MSAGVPGLKFASAKSMVADVTMTGLNRHSKSFFFDSKTNWYLTSIVRICAYGSIIEIPAHMTNLPDLFAISLESRNMVDRFDYFFMQYRHLLSRRRLRCLEKIEGLQKAVG